MRPSNRALDPAGARPGKPAGPGASPGCFGTPPWAQAALVALALGVLLVVLLLLARPARASLPPGQQIDQLEACQQCHDLSDALKADHPHQPVVSGECTACHNPHVSRFDSLLLDQPGPLCGQCHTDVAEELERPVVHQPVAEGRCAQCHQPHGNDRSGLLRAGGEELCATCHEEVGLWGERPVQHPPFATGDCQACHEPHASENPSLLAAPGGKVCLRCHDQDAAFRKAHSGYPVERAACQQCHDPHASEVRGLFRETSHPPFESGDCAVCHNGPNDRNPFAITMPIGELCGMCHGDVVAAAEDAPFPHVPAGGGDCVSCHNPHTGVGQALLKTDEQDLCLSCHDPGGSKSGQEGRHVTHGGGLECTTCHKGHGSDRPLLLANDPIELCGECHSHEHSVTHPLGEDTHDPRTGNPMTCRSCHGMHDSPYEHYLLRSGDRELCLSCHKEIGGRR